MMHIEPSSSLLRARRPIADPVRPCAQAAFQPRNHAELSPPSERGGPQRRGRPFRDAESCIFWTIKTLAAEAEGRASPPARDKTGKRPPAAAVCTPAEVVKCLDTLYRRRRIDLHHVRILRLWGHRGRAPSPDLPMEKGDWRVWREALDRLDWPLRSLGIVS